MVSGKSIVDCPFCYKIEIVAFHKPSFLQAHTSRISAGAKTEYYRVPERYFIQSDCPHCGAKKKDIQAWYDGTYVEPRTHEEKIARLKKRGLSLVLGRS